MPSAKRCLLDRVGELARRKPTPGSRCSEICPVCCRVLLLRRDFWHTIRRTLATPEVFAKTNVLSEASTNQKLTKELRPHQPFLLCLCLRQRSCALSSGRMFLRCLHGVSASLFVYDIWTEQPRAQICRMHARSPALLRFLPSSLESCWCCCRYT